MNGILGYCFFCEHIFMIVEVCMETDEVEGVVTHTDTTSQDENPPSVQADVEQTENSQPDNRVEVEPDLPSVLPLEQKDNPNSCPSVACEAVVSSQQIFLYNYNFNQDMSCFSISTSSDFRTFLLGTANGISEVSRRRVNTDKSGNFLTNDPSPVNVASMLFQTNYLALVMRENPYKVLLWDDSLKQAPHEIWSRFEILNVVLRRDIICVVSEFKIYVYQFGGHFSVLLHMETFSNPKGLCMLSCAGKDWVMVCPGSLRGSVRIQIGLDDSISSTVPAHTNAVAALGINQYGTMVASASEHGTVVKIFNSADGQILYELRRGTIGTQISSITFSCDNKFLAVGSSNPTVHVFRLDVPGSAVALGHSAVLVKAQKFFGKISEWAVSNSPILESVLAVAPPAVDPTPPLEPSPQIAGPNNPSPSTEKLVPKYFKSYRSFATFRIPEKSAMDLRIVNLSPICGPIVTFSKTKPNHLIVVHFNGLMYEAAFDDSKFDGQQECTLISATAYFQARPDFVVQQSSTTEDVEGGTLEDSNWLVI